MKRPGLLLTFVLALGGISWPVDSAPDRKAPRGGSDQQAGAERHRNPPPAPASHAPERGKAEREKRTAKEPGSLGKHPHGNDERSGVQRQGMRDTDEKDKNALLRTTAARTEPGRQLFDALNAPELRMSRDHAAFDKAARNARSQLVTLLRDNRIDPRARYRDVHRLVLHQPLQLGTRGVELIRQRTTILHTASAVHVYAEPALDAIRFTSRKLLLQPGTRLEVIEASGHGPWFVARRGDRPGDKREFVGWIYMDGVA